MASEPVTGMPGVDAHHHVWDVSAHPQPWLDSDEALAPLRRKFAVADLAPHAAALIPASHGVLALTTFLLAVLAAVGAV